MTSWSSIQAMTLTDPPQRLQLGVVVEFENVYFEGPGFEDEPEAASALGAVH